LHVLYPAEIDRISRLVRMLDLGLDCVVNIYMVVNEWEGQCILFQIKYLQLQFFLLFFYCNVLLIVSNILTHTSDFGLNCLNSVK